MKKYHYLFVLLMTLIFICCKEDNVQKTKSVNPYATAEVSNLLDFLYEIEGKYTLTGHHNGPKNTLRYMTGVKEITGYTPVVWGSDFMFDYKSDEEADRIRQGMIDTAKILWDKGHIITLMWHSCYPPNGDTCDYESIWIWDDVISDEEWNELTTPGTDLNNIWKTQVDRVAEFLKQLQVANIPVLWRPYHEMNGVWFWWCRHPGEEGFIKLWRMMYDYFTNHHKLNNLIWVWNPNAPRDKEGDEAYAYKDYFPGLDYVDVLAADVYHNDYRQSHHDQLLELAQGKPIAFGEVGRMPSPEILEEQPNWTWFMGWANWLYKANTPDSVKALYNSSRTITLDMIEKDDEGRFTIIQQ